MYAHWSKDLEIHMTKWIDFKMSIALLSHLNLLSQKYIQSYQTVTVIEAAITQCDLSATTLLKLDLNLIAFKFSQ